MPFSNLLTLLRKVEPHSKPATKPETNVYVARQVREGMKYAKHRRSTSTVTMLRTKLYGFVARISTPFKLNKKQMKRKGSQNI